MALKLDPVRLLVADDVGIGKTIEAGLVAREARAAYQVHLLSLLLEHHKEVSHLGRQFQDFVDK